MKVRGLRVLRGLSQPFVWELAATPMGSGLEVNPQTLQTPQGYSLTDYQRDAGFDDLDAAPSTLPASHTRAREADLERSRQERLVRVEREREIFQGPAASPPAGQRAGLRCAPAVASLAAAGVPGGKDDGTRETVAPGRSETRDLVGGDDHKANPRRTAAPGPCGDWGISSEEVVRHYDLMSEAALVTSPVRPGIAAGGVLGGAIPPPGVVGDRTRGALGSGDATPVPPSDRLGRTSSPELPRSARPEASIANRHPGGI